MNAKVKIFCVLFAQLILLSCMVDKNPLSSRAPLLELEKRTGVLQTVQGSTLHPADFEVVSFAGKSKVSDRKSVV